MDSVIQRSFAAGEISPSIYARSEQIKFQTGLRRCKNFIVRKHGGVRNRAGTVFVDNVRGNATEFRLIKFVFASGEAYALVLADGFMRIYLENEKVNTDFAVGWSTASDYVVGDVVIQTANYYYCILAHTSSALNQPPNTTYWVQITQGYYEVPIPWASSHLRDLQYIQSGDVVFVVHPSYKPKKIVRFQKGSNLLWKIEDVEFNSTVPRPTGISITGSAGTTRVRYKITTVQKGTYLESLPAINSYETILTISKSNPCIVKIDGDRTADIKAGDAVEILDHPTYLGQVLGMREIVNQEFIVKSVTLVTGPATEIELLGVDSTNYTTYSGGGSLARIEAVYDLAPASESNPITISVNTFTGAECYFYKRDDRGYGFIGYSTDGKFIDKGYSVNPDELPPSVTNVFSLPGDFPSVIGLAQQRLVFANTVNEPEKIFMSRIGDYTNFTTRNPLQDDDALSFVIANREISPIRHVIDLDKMVVLSHSYESMINGDEATGSILPTAINPKTQSFNGSSSVRPVVVDDTVIYVSSRSRTVRDLQRAVIVDEGRTAYSGKDLTVYAGHLFEKHNIIVLDFNKQESIVWAVRDDGIMLGLTYLPEHRLWGWHWHETDGQIKDIVVIPESDRDVEYLIIKRTINGADKYYIESIASRHISDIRIDAVFTDSSVKYDGRGRLGGDLVISGGSTWGNGDIVTVTSTTGPFSSGDINNVAVVIHESGSEVFRINVTEYINSNVVKGSPNKTIPAEYRNTSIPQSKIAKGIKIISSWYVGAKQYNLSHLEGKSLSILGEGNVVSDGVNPPLYTVNSGQIVLDRPHWLLTMGLPYNSDFESLDLDVPDAMKTVLNKTKRIPVINVMIEESRGLKAGPDFNNLRPYKQREFEPMGEPTALKTGVVEVGLDTSWRIDSRISIRQSDPLPLTILAMIPHVDLGG